MKNIELLPNKLLSVLLLVVGLFTASIDGDGTALLFISLIAVPMFIAKENWTIFQIISEEVDDEQRPEKECLRVSRSNGIRSAPKCDKRARDRTLEQIAVNDSVHI